MDNLEQVPSDTSAYLRLIDSPAFYNAVRKTSHDAWSWPDDKLDREFGSLQAARAFRNKLWSAIGASLGTGSKIKISSLCGEDTCTKQRMYQLFREKPCIVVWLLSPGKGIQKYVTPVVESSIANKIWDLLSLPLVDDNGNVIVPNAEIILRVNALIGEKRLG